ncbi:hypothetical protein FA95DRAFT_1602174 [Auriscalpium vulgare]|uniref:Uncharacterized protein n=1 Tax=Auriscalpium vulgare TaxID=40419 RepID=A0ACB8S7U7_9AGAM|nr:hypothetical protein FA95DRAFT_1602174 [Auriscalpium vulgare]
MSLPIVHSEISYADMTGHLCQAIELVNLLHSIARWAAEVNHPRLAEIMHGVRVFIHLIALYPGADDLMATSFGPIMDVVQRLEVLLINPLANFEPTAPGQFFPRQLNDIVMQVPGASPSRVYMSIDAPFVGVPDLERTHSILPPIELVLRAGSVCRLLVNVNPLAGWSANTLVVVQELHDTVVVVKNLVDRNGIILPRWLFWYLSVRSDWDVAIERVNDVLTREAERRQTGYRTLLIHPSRTPPYSVEDLMCLISGSAEDDSSSTHQSNDALKDVRKIYDKDSTVHGWYYSLRVPGSRSEGKDDAVKSIVSDLLKPHARAICGIVTVVKDGPWATRAEWDDGLLYIDRFASTLWWYLSGEAKVDQVFGERELERFLDLQM